MWNLRAESQCSAPGNPLDSVSSFRTGRQGNLEDRAASMRTHAAPHEDFAMVVFDDPDAECQSKPGATVGLRGEEGLKDRVSMLVWYTVTVIGNHKVHLVPAMP